MLCVVQKPFRGPDGMMERGELVDASGWRNTPLLIDQRYMRLATQSEIDSAEEVEDDTPPKQRPLPETRTRPAGRSRFKPKGRKGVIGRKGVSPLSHRSAS